MTSASDALTTTATPSRIPRRARKSGPMVFGGRGDVKWVWTDGQARLPASAPREVRVAGPHRDRLALLEVTHLHDAAHDLRQRPVAAILDQPLRPDHRGRAVLALRAEAALAVAPQPPRLLLLERRSRLALAAALQVAGQRQR